MKIYNKNQFLASLCSLNDKASTHSAAIVWQKVILQHWARQEPCILSDPIADSNMIQTYWYNGRHLISSVESKKKLSDIFWGLNTFMVRILSRRRQTRFSLSMVHLYPRQHLKIKICFKLTSHDGMYWLIFVNRWHYLKLWFSIKYGFKG